MDGALSMAEKIIRIGCGGGFWGDSPEGAFQIVRRGGVRYLVMDYLAEITMSILARMKAKSPEAGFTGDFIDLVMKPLAPEIAAQGIRVVVNAGGVNLEACRAALEAVFQAQGLTLKIATVQGDDLSGAVEDLRALGAAEMFSGAPMPGKFASVNAYLGAFGIAKALDAGADVVLTGRVVDSALVLGPLIHEFGWSETEYDKLSAGSLAGHLLECGPQATGGIFTDWRKAAPGWDDMGFPIALCRADGSFEITKPEGTGGLVSPQSVAEQTCYEVGDPAAYPLPDVLCDWSAVALEQAGPDRVRVSGARGRAPGDKLKVTATWSDGWRSAATMMIAGREAAEKAQAVGEAILKRVSRLIAEAGMPPFAETQVEVLGAESNYGAQSRARSAREVVLKIAARHPDRRALEIFGREIYPSASSMAQGITGFAGGRPTPQPVVRLFSCLAPKSLAPVTMRIGDTILAVPWAETAAPPPPSARLLADGAAAGEETAGPLVRVPLIALAHGRSGDKGDKANIALLARSPEYLPWIRRGVTAEAVAECFAHFVKGKVERFDWPGLNGFNFLMDQALGGGGIASLRHDPQGKALAQILLDLPVAVPAAWIAEGAALADFAEEALPDET